MLVEIISSISVALRNYEPPSKNLSLHTFLIHDAQCSFAAQFVRTARTTKIICCIACYVANAVCALRPLFWSNKC